MYLTKIVTQDQGKEGKRLIVAPANGFTILGLLKSARWDLVQPKHGSIGVLDKYVLALGHMHAHVDDGANNTPSIREVEIHLVSEFAGLVSDDTENYVPVAILGIRTGDESVGESVR